MATETFPRVATLDDHKKRVKQWSSAMIELLATVCLISSPQECKEVHLSYAADSVTPHQCMMFGQVELAKWNEGQPKWRVAKWKCQPAGRVAKI